MPIQVEVGDKEFKDSPDTGHPDCICSRCGNKIPSRQFALRIFTGKKKNTEFRYCEPCQTKDMGIIHGSRFDEDDEEDENFYSDDIFD